MDFAFTEDPHAQEGGFEEESHERFHCEGSAENIANKAGVLRPVHTELEFLHNAGDYANGKVDEEKFSPELGHFAVFLITGLVVAALKIRHKPGKTQCEGDEEEVVDGRDAELPASQCHLIHGRNVLRGVVAGQSSLGWRRARFRRP